MNNAWERYCELQKERPEEFRQSELLQIIMDDESVRAFEEKERAEGREVTIGVVYESAYSLLVVDLVQDSNGRRFAYERLIKKAKNQGVVCIARYQGRYCLLKQYRHAMRGEQFAFVRGFGEDDITIEQNVEKEIKEELHSDVIACEYVGQVIADSGLCGNSVLVYLCDVTKPRLQIGYEEIGDLLLVTKEEMEKHISSGAITDGFTLAAWLLLGTDR